MRVSTVVLVTIATSAMVPTTQIMRVVLEEITLDGEEPKKGAPARA